MAPLRESRSWSIRYEDEVKIEPLSRYYLIFEGANTEVKYFKGLQDFSKEIGIHNLIELIILHKEGEIRNYSSPKKLLELINQKKKELEKDGNFERNIDKFVIIFDRDSFEKEENYLEFLKIASVDNILAVTSPCFEIWLLLHYVHAINKYIKPNKKDMIENKKVSSSHSMVSKLISELSGVNPKRNVNFSYIKENINLAIEQEKLLVQDAKKMFNDIGSNIGLLIEKMKKDPREKII